MEPSNWAPEHSGALQEYFALGMSYAEIARAINAKFGTHFSRSASIGRARRLGLGPGIGLGSNLASPNNLSNWRRSCQRSSR